MIALKKGDACYVLGAGMFGTLTRITKLNIGWVKVRSRWGNHHHPVTAKTFRYSMDRIVSEADGRNINEENRMSQVKPMSDNGSLDYLDEPAGPEDLTDHETDAERNQ